jgi:urease gamma subunit
MKFKMVLLAFTAVSVLVFGAGMISAQEATTEFQRGDGIVREVLEIVAEATGLTGREIADRVRAGETLAEIITAQGGDVAAVTSQIVSAITERVNTAVAEGRITQERADEILLDLEARVTLLLNGEYELAGAGLGRGDRGGIRGEAGFGVLQRAAEATGLTVQEIVTQMRDGQPLAAVLSANGVDVQTFIDETVAEFDARMAEAVTAGRITQEEADQRSVQFREELTERINSTDPLPEREGRRGGRGA